MDKKKNRILIVVGIVAALVLIAGIIIVSGTGSSTRDNTILLAADYIERGEYDRALDLLEDILIQDPEDEEAIALRNRALEQKLLANEAGRDATDISLDTSADTSGTRQTEPVPVAEADPEELALQQQLETQRREEERRRREEELARQRAEEERLRALSEEEAAIQRKISALLTEARELQEANQFASARGKINEAIDLDTESALPYARLAENYIEEDIKNADNRSKAIDFAEISIGKDPKLWEPHYTLGRIFNAAKQYDRAIQALSTAVEFNASNADIFYALGNAQFDARLYSAARESYETCVFLDSSNERAFFNLGLTFERLDLDSSAIANYQKAVAVRTDYAAAYNRIGEIQLERGEFNNARSNLVRALNYDNNARNNRALARVFYEQGEYAQALEFFLVAVALEPNRAQNQYNVATVLLDLNRPDEALRYAAEAVRLDAALPEYNYTLGLVLKDLGNVEQANTYFRTAIAQRSNYLKPRIELSDSFILEENYDAALRELLIAYRIDPSRSDVNNNLATVYRLEELHEDSLRHSMAAIAAEPNSAIIRYNLSLTFIRMEQFVQAESSLKSTIGIDADYLDAYLRLGEVLLAQEKSEEALRVLNELIARAPGTVQADEAANIIESL